MKWIKPPFARARVYPAGYKPPLVSFDHPHCIDHHERLIERPYLLRGGIPEALRAVGETLEYNERQGRLRFNRPAFSQWDKSPFPESGGIGAQLHFYLRKENRETPYYTNFWGIVLLCELLELKDEDELEMVLRNHTTLKMAKPFGGGKWRASISKVFEELAVYAEKRAWRADMALKIMGDLTHYI